jgi:multimeric flavodoxin WrbA
MFESLADGYQRAVADRSEVSSGVSLTALALACSLKPSPAPSSSQLIAEHLLGELRSAGVAGEVIRCVDYDVKPGVEADMGNGDQWPTLREKVLAADILVISTPTWLGHMSSVAQRVLERLDAELSETDDAGRPILTGKVAVATVVGNEDGAHKIVADLFQALNDVGYTIPAQGCTYWNGPAMQTTDYKDLDEVPEAVASTTAAAARNAAHLAAMLKRAPYPPYEK